MPAKHGTSNIARILRGTAEIGKAYRGTVLVFSSEEIYPIQWTTLSSHVSYGSWIGTSTYSGSGSSRQRLYTRSRVRIYRESQTSNLGNTRYRNRRVSLSSESEWRSSPVTFTPAPPPPPIDIPIAPDPPPIIDIPVVPVPQPVIEIWPPTWTFLYSTVSYTNWVGSGYRGSGINREQNFTRTRTVLIRESQISNLGNTRHRTRNVETLESEWRSNPEEIWGAWIFVRNTPSTYGPWFTHNVYRGSGANREQQWLRSREYTRIEMRTSNLGNTQTRSSGSNTFEREWRPAPE